MNYVVLHQSICCGYSLESLGVAILMSTFNICYHEKLRNDIPKLSSNISFSGCNWFKVDRTFGLIWNPLAK